MASPRKVSSTCQAARPPWGACEGGGTAPTRTRGCSRPAILDQARTNAGAWAASGWAAVAWGLGLRNTRLASFLPPSQLPSAEPSHLNGQRSGVSSAVRPATPQPRPAACQRTERAPEAPLVVAVARPAGVEACALTMGSAKGVGHCGGPLRRIEQAQPQQTLQADAWPAPGALTTAAKAHGS